MESDFLEFRCVGIEDGGKIPIENTGRGQDISPEFVIENFSQKAKTLAVTLEDLLHPIKNFTHWIIWNIPAMNKVEKGIEAGKEVVVLGNARQGIGYGVHRYAGPKPPKGKKHIYRFSIYALDCGIDLSSNSMKKAFLKKAQGHILQKGSITAEFE